MTQTRTRSRTQFWILVALFFGPLAASFVWYYGLEDLRPTADAQHGTLVQPPQPLPEARLRMPDGTRTEAGFLTGYWSLVAFAAGRCEQHCRDALIDLRQLRLALGRERGRVQLILLYTGTPPDPQWLAAELPLLQVASVDDPQADALLARFPGAGRAASDGGGTVYLVDPLGNLMMAYGPDRTLRGMHDDLKRLLRLSHIG